MKKSIKRYYALTIAFFWKTAVDRLRGKGLQRIWPLGPIYYWMTRTFKTYEWPEANTAHGHTIYTFPELRSTFAIWHGKEDEAYFRLFAKEIPPGGTVADVGANIGYYALTFARIVGARGKVFSFEPEPENLKYFRKNVEANGYKNIVLVPKAVGNESGKTQLYLARHSGGHQIYDMRKAIATMPKPEEHYRVFAEDRKKQGDFEQSVPVDIVSLDDFFEGYDKPIDFIKIDVEGAEDGVIAGMKTILDKNPQTKIFFEFTPSLLKLRNADPQTVLKIFIDRGFKLYNMHDKKNEGCLEESASIEELIGACKENSGVDVFAKK